ncbi:MAG: ATP-binding protein [Anaerolineae bacterium]
MNGDPDTVHSVKRGLERDGCHVLTACNGREALAIMERERPDLIVADTRMPAEDLFALMEARLRGALDLPGISAVPIAELEQRLVQSNRLATVGQMTAGFIHDINNSLLSISGYAHLVQRCISEEEHPGVVKDIKTIISHADRMTSLVRSLLGFLRGKDGERKAIPIHQVIDRALAFFMSYWLDKREIEIRKEYTSHSPMVLADADQLEQVFLNLALNALQAMPEGGAITVATQTLNHEDGDFVKIDFTDTGCGISPENLDKLFQPFFTTKGEEGAGLGLYVSHCIIERHGGTIEAKSGLGAGTTFTIKLPTVESSSRLSLHL